MNDTNRRIGFLVTGFALACGPAAAFAQAPVEKVAIVAVAGCLQEDGAGSWILVRATDPVPSTANAPPASSAPSNVSPSNARTTAPRPQADPSPTSEARKGAANVPAATSGKNQFKLIGVSEFDLPSRKGQTILVKALHIKATPVDRLNVTSVTTLSPSCASAPE